MGNLSGQVGGRRNALQNLWPTLHCIHEVVDLRGNTLNWVILGVIPTKYTVPIERGFCISWKVNTRDLWWPSGYPRDSAQLNTVMFNPRHECITKAFKDVHSLYQVSVTIVSLTSYCVSWGAEPCPNTIEQEFTMCRWENLHILKKTPWMEQLLPKETGVNAWTGISFTKSRRLPVQC